jgi:hypothetical protein
MLLLARLVSATAIFAVMSLVGVTAAICVAMVALSFVHGLSRTVDRVVFVSCITAGVLMGLSFVHREMRIWRRTDRQRQGRCIHCGYDLRASNGQCPECGAYA